MILMIRLAKKEEKKWKRYPLKNTHKKKNEENIKKMKKRQKKKRDNIKSYRQIY